MSLIVIQEKQKKTKKTWWLAVIPVLYGRTHRPHNHHNHNGDLRMTMDRNRCSFLVNGADQTKLTRLVTSAHHSYSVLIIVSVHIPDSHGDLRRPTEYSRRQAVCESCTPGRSFIAAGVTAYLVDSLISSQRRHWWGLRTQWDIAFVVIITATST